MPKQTHAKCQSCNARCRNFRWVNWGGKALLLCGNCIRAGKQILLKERNLRNVGAEINTSGTEDSKIEDSGQSVSEGNSVSIGE